MDRHHDTDALTAYKSQIKVYQPETTAENQPDTVNTINEEDEAEFNEYDLDVAQRTRPTKSAFQEAKGSLIGTIELVTEAFQNF